MTVLNKPDIVEYISKYVDLERAGQNYKGLCPFHTEKTPSFIVSPSRQTGHCFGGCGWHGDVIKFIQDYKGISFKDALAYLGIGNSNGKRYRPDPVKIWTQALKQIYRHWKNEYCLYLADLLRWKDQAAALCRDIKEVEALSEIYHKATLWELEYDILISKDEQEKLNLFRSKYEQQHRSAA